MNEWEYVAEALRYDLDTIEAIKERGGGDPKLCCREFFKDWLTTNNGARAGSKVWSTLFDVLKEVDEISADVTEDIIAEVKQLRYSPQGMYLCTCVSFIPLLTIITVLTVATVHCQCICNVSNTTVYITHNGIFNTSSITLL